MEEDDVPAGLIEQVEQADEFLDRILDGPFLAIVISPETGVHFYRRDDLTKDDLRQMLEALTDLIEGE